MKAQYSEADLRTASLWLIDHPMVGESALAQLIADVRAAQRERDAKICDEYALPTEGVGNPFARVLSRQLAERIREGT